MAKYMIKEAGGDQRVLNIIEWNEVDVVDLVTMGYPYCHLLQWDGTPVWEPVPQIVSPAQFRRALRLMGMYQHFQAFVAQLDEASREEIEYANEFRRNHPFMELARVQMGMSKQDGDNFFRFAASLLL